MNTVRLLAATAVAALIAGPVSAQTMSTTGSTQTTTSGSMSNQGMNQTMSSQSSMSGQGMAMGQGSMQRCMTPMAGGDVGASMSGNMNAGGAMGSSMSGNAAAGGSMGASASMSGGTMSCMNDMGKIVVSNAPIPDSPSTRAMTGGPDSMGGKMTAPRPGPVRKATRSRRR